MSGYLPGFGSKKTLAERAVTKVERAKRKHKAALDAYIEAVIQWIPDAILDCAELGETHLTVDLVQIKVWKTCCEQDKFFLCGRNTLKAEDWDVVRDRLIQFIHSQKGVEVKWLPDHTDFELSWGYRVG